MTIQLPNFRDDALAGAEQRRDRFAEIRDRGGHLHTREEPFVLADAEPHPEGGAETPDGIVDPDARLDQMPAGGNDRAHAVCHRRIGGHLLVDPVRASWAKPAASCGSALLAFIAPDGRRCIRSRRPARAGPAIDRVIRPVSITARSIGPCCSAPRRSSPARYRRIALRSFVHHHRRHRRASFPSTGLIRHSVSWLLPSGFDNQKCAPSSRPEEAATHYAIPH